MANVRFTITPGQQINLALDWPGSTVPAPPPGNCYVGPDPQAQMHAWGHRRPPHLSRDMNSLIFHVTVGKLHNFIEEILDGIGTITIQATEVTATATTTSSATFEVVDIGSDPCDE